MLCCHCLTRLPVQPEVCSNISGAPSNLYHRADAARQCHMHSLCILPLFMPSVTRKAPIAVLEVLQPDPQPDFAILSNIVRSRCALCRVAGHTITAPLCP